HPEIFAVAAPLSATTGSNWIVKNTNATDEQKEAYKRNYTVETIIDNASKEALDNIKKVRWYISCGDDDFLYKDNSELHVLFRNKKIPHEYRVKDGGHTWTYWRMELALVMEFASKSFSQF
ncbi:MAG: esterase family protein, partial [Tannerella sp.]|nr:esterase family protein [Tannerella sp.]